MIEPSKFQTLGLHLLQKKDIIAYSIITSIVSMGIFHSYGQEILKLIY
jgi:hypothetical protein